MHDDREYILKLAHDNKIRFIRLWFTDILGFLKSFAITIDELEDAINEGVRFDGATLHGYIRSDEEEMIALPDVSTFQVLPWRPKEDSVARMFCDILTPLGEPAKSDPRNVLKRTMAKAAKQGFTFYTHPEIEFFLLKDEITPGVEPTPVDSAGYFDHTALGGGVDFRRTAITMLEQMGISVEFSHHEAAPGQQEIDLRHADALTMADNIMTFRAVVKEVAIERGLITEAQAAGFDWSPLEYFTDLFPGEGNGLIALLGERAVRLLPGEAPESFSLRETNLSNVRVLCSLRDTGGALLLGTERGLFRSTDGGATWSEIALP